eukprot:COSAG03_NODE_738_length_6028_cov_159.171698_2_plen_111_part_00
MLTLGSRVVSQPHMKLSLAYPVAGTQKLIEIDDDAKLCVVLCPPRARTALVARAVRHRACPPQQLALGTAYAGGQAQLRLGLGSGATDSSPHAPMRCVLPRDFFPALDSC